MAKIITSEEFKSMAGSGRCLNYPWAEWTDGQARILTMGTDFDTTVTGFRSTLASYAARRGLRAITSVRSEKEIAVQFVKRTAQ